MRGREAVAAEDVVEPQYTDAKTCVWWDIENCQVPRGFDAYTIAQNINTALSRMGYCGNVSISAYGDTNRIPNGVQQALSSTGIALNHVPAGAKDASDKKILVDMLLWAIDNRAPANYLLISGDRDFSNALHQLRMRRYNILLAQPYKASPALVAAAKTVWLWTSLLAGDGPITKNESTRLVNGNVHSNQEATPDYIAETARVFQPVVKLSHIPAVANNNFTASFKVGSGDPNYKGKHVKKLNQPSMTKAQSVQMGIQDSKSSDYNHLSEYGQTRVVKKAPHEFFRPHGHSVSASCLGPNNFSGNPDSSANNVKELARNHSISASCSGRNNFSGNPDSSANNVKELIGNLENQYPSHPRPKVISLHFKSSPRKMIKANPAISAYFEPSTPDGSSLSSAPSTSSLDIGKLSLSEYPNDVQPSLNLAHPIGEVSKLNSRENSNPGSGNSLQTGPDILKNVPPYHNPSIRHPPEFSLSSPSPTPANIPSCSGIYGAGGHTLPPSKYELGLLELVLHALYSLRNEKILPTEANIADCIRFGDLKNCNTDVKMALDVAIKRQVVTRHTLGGDLQLYVNNGQKIWSCINPVGGSPNQYSKAIWDKIKKFLTSSSGQSAIVSSSCKYEVALTLKSSCLQDLPLGDVLRILNMLAEPKKWIKHNLSGWQPVTITLTEHPGNGSNEVAS